MDMEEIILEHIAIKEQADWFVKDVLKENPQDRKLTRRENVEKASA